MGINLSVTLPSGITCVEGSGHHTGVCCYYKKVWWLRLYHMFMFIDCSPFLLDAFGRPVSSNYSFPDASTYIRTESKSQYLTSVERGLRDMIFNGYKSSISSNQSKMNISKVDSLHDLVWCPWRCRKSDCIVYVVKDSDYRIGLNKLRYSFGGAMRELRIKLNK